MIFCCSSDYLKALEEESRAFRFNIQGYTSPKNSLDGLLSTNIIDIGGFVVIEELLTRSKSLTKYLKTIDTLSEFSAQRKRLIVSVGADDDVPQIKEYLLGLNLNNLDIYLDQFEELSDLYIKRKIFGMILLDLRRPYTKPKPPSIDFSEFLKTRSIRYRMLLSPNDYSLFKPVEVGLTFEELLATDLSLSTYNPWDMHYKLRVLKLLKVCRGDHLLKYLELYEEINNTTDEELKVHYKSLLELIYFEK